jgi:uncharacterized protein YdeI (BOF family)
MNRNEKSATQTLRFPMLLVIACAMMAVSFPLHAQTSPAGDPRYSTQQPGQMSGQQPQTQPRQDPTAAGQPAADSSQAGGQVFTGTIVKSGDKFVFQDAESGTTYDVDHQDQVKQFEGKKVRIHGTLDASGKKIHVQ